MAVFASSLGFYMAGLIGRLRGKFYPLQRGQHVPWLTHLEFIIGSPAIVVPPMCTDLQELTFLEFFAGEGKVWRCLRADSIGSIGVDIEYWDRDGSDNRQNPFDILSTAGLGWDPQK